MDEWWWTVATEVIGGLLVAGLLALAGWLGARLLRRHRREASSRSLPGPFDSAQGKPPLRGEGEKREAPLRVLVALPRPLLTLLREEGGEWVPAADWDEATGALNVPPLAREWKAEAIERALRGTGAPLMVRFLDHPTAAELRSALDDGYDVLVVNTHGEPDGTLPLPCRPGPVAGGGKRAAGAPFRLLLGRRLRRAAQGRRRRRGGHG